MPTVSVILPVFNAEKYLENALVSLSNQTFKNFEVIAIDDGSGDGSARILERFAKEDVRFRLISRPNTGIVGALEDARKLAKGRYIARMDADDWSDPNRFDRQIELLDANSDLVAIGSDVIFMDEDGNRVENCKRETDPIKIRNALLSGDGGALIHPSVMFRAVAVESVGGYRRSSQFLEDLDLFLRLDLIGTLSNCSESLLKYRVHAKSINFQRIASRESTKKSVLQNAHEIRGLRYRQKSRPSGEDFCDQRRLHRKWAVTSTEFGERSVAISHGWKAVRLCPTDTEAWRALRYASTAAIGSGVEHPRSG